MSKVLYFAYGSDMSLRQMQQRLVESQILVDESSRMPARLQGYEFGFFKYVPQHPLVGHAGIRPQADGLVEGVVYHLPADAMALLDGFQKVLEGHYRREEVSVLVGEGFPDAETLHWVPAKAYAYLPHADWIRTGLQPSRNHLYRLLAAERYLSSEWFQKLRSTPSLKIPVDDEGMPYPAKN